MRRSISRDTLLFSRACAAVLFTCGTAPAQPCNPVWSAFPSPPDGLNGIPEALVIHEDDGGGPALFAGGLFDQAGGTPAYIAKWNGQDWLPLGGGVDGFVHAMVSFDPFSTGPELYAAGEFQNAGGNPARLIAKWGPHGWSPVGEYPGEAILSLGVSRDEFFTRELYTGDANGHVFRWANSAWTAVDDLPSSVYAFASLEGRAGPVVYAGGRFDGVYRLDSGRWAPVGSLNGRVYVLQVFDDGGGPALYAGGAFTDDTGNPVGHIARWDGSAWLPLGEGLDNDAVSMAVFDDGRGPALYVGGWFSSAGGQPAAYIARWDGREWSPLGAGTNNLVRSLVAFQDDPSRPSLYAGGDFANAGDVLAGRIARWGCPACRADFNGDGAANSQDFFDFLSAFFAGAAAADFNRDGSINSQDFFDFLTAFFAGCP